MILNSDKIINIPLCNSFLDEISKILLDKVNNDSQQLSQYLLLLPNYRLIKNLQYSFLKNSQAKSLILPKMVSLGNLNYFFEDVNILSKSDLENLHYEDFFKNTISKNQRSFILSKLIRKKESNISINQAIYLANQLGIIIDKGYQEEVDFKNLDKIIDVNLAKHWQDIIKFLDIATISWGAILKDRNMVDEIYKQNLIYKIQHKLWQKQPPNYPVISIHMQSYFKNIINLNKQILNLSQGQLFFYGMDKQELNENNKLSFSHPQKIFQYMLDKMDVSIKDVNFVKSNHTEKENFIHRIFDNQIYQEFSKKEMQKITSNLSLINTKQEEQEAQSIALILRETLETPNKTAGLICNNPNLILRIKNELLKWNININDYSGENLYHSTQAKLFLLVGEAIANNFEFNTMLALLKNPFVKFNMPRSKVIYLSQQLDKLIFRQPNNDNSLDTIKNLIAEQKSNPKNQYLNQIYDELHEFIINIQNNFESLLKIANNPINRINVADTLTKHIAIVEKISLNDDKKSDAWTYQEGKTLSLLLANLLEETQDLEPMQFNEYLKIITDIIKSQEITQIYNKHPRLFIYGSLQSTGISHDIMILANVNEEEIPLRTSSNIWLNKYLMNSIGLIDDDYKIGLDAQIFSQVLGAQEPILIRSEKNKGNLTSPNRWLLKIQTTLKAYGIEQLSKYNHIENILPILNKPKQIIPYQQIPQINCENNLKPIKLSATKLELLIQNPYVFFIRHVLNINPLEDINPKIDEAQFGTKIHRILELFMTNINNYTNNSIAEQIKIINSIAKDELASINNTIKFKIFKLPLIHSTLQKFIENQYVHFQNLSKSYLEVDGLIEVNLENTTIKITGRADRIDIDNQNNALIIDYKTSANDKINDYQKQLLILSTLLHKGGFKDINNTPNNIQAQYMFLPKKIDKEISIKDMDSLYEITNFNDYSDQFENELIALLTKYYTKNEDYIWSSDKNIQANYLHFARYLEFNNNLIDINEDNNLEDEDE
jgi:ATP-dependent helicase/nuclease subunit B